jgi:hypothetical protein
MHFIITDDVTVTAMNSWQRWEEIKTQKYRHAVAAITCQGVTIALTGNE